MKTIYDILFVEVTFDNPDMESALSEELKILQQDDNEIIKVEFLKSVSRQGYFAVIHFRCPVVEEKPHYYKKLN